MKKTLLFIAVLGLFSLASAQTAIRNGKDYALFFVTTHFDQWPALPESDKDVRALASELETNYGFQKADIRLNLSRAETIKTLVDYQKKAFGPNDQLLVFFSTHGFYDDAIGALIPKDGKLDDPSYESWITHPTLEAMVTRIQCQHVLLALDACYSGTFSAKFRDRPGSPAWEAESDCASKCVAALKFKSRLYLTSGGKERTPAQSQFIKKWLEGLRVRNFDGIMSFYELYAVLSEATPKPMSGDFKDHAAGGDFIFVIKNGCSNKGQVIESKPKFPTLSSAEVIQKYLSAIGGKKAYSDINNYSLEAIFTLGSLGDTRWKVAKASNGRIWYQVTLNNEVFLELKSDGKRSLLKDGEGKHWLTESEKQQNLETAEMYFNAVFREATFQQEGVIIQSTHLEQLSNRAVYVMDYEEPKEKSTCTVYYDAETGLKLLEKEKFFQDGNAMNGTSEYSDYQEINGYKMPFFIKLDSDKPIIPGTDVRNFRILVTSIQINGIVDDKLFKL